METANAIQLAWLFRLVYALDFSGGPRPAAAQGESKSILSYDSFATQAFQDAVNKSGTKQGTVGGGGGVIVVDPKTTARMWRGPAAAAVHLRAQ